MFLVEFVPKPTLAGPTHFIHLENTHSSLALRQHTDGHRAACVSTPQQAMDQRLSGRHRCAAQQLENALLSLARLHQTHDTAQSLSRGKRQQGQYAQR